MRTTNKQKLENLKKQLWFHENMENKGMTETLKERIKILEDKINS